MTNCYVTEWPFQSLNIKCCDAPLGIVMDRPVTIECLQFSQPLPCYIQPQPRACTVLCPYLARVWAHIQLRAALDWTGHLSVKQVVQYLDLLRREQLPSHLLPEEVPSTVAMPIGQWWLLQTCAKTRGRLEKCKRRDERVIKGEQV